MAGTIVASTINNDTGLFSTNNAYLGIAKAWGQFSMSGTTITLNGSFNISSVTYVATGYYTVNFTTTMPNINYCAIGNSSINQSATNFCTLAMFAQTASPYYLAPTTSSFGITSQIVGVGAVNPVYVTFAVFSS